MITCTVPPVTILFMAMKEMIASWVQVVMTYWMEAKATTPCLVEKAMIVYWEERATIRFLVRRVTIP